jgi:hypothetical protein
MPSSDPQGVSPSSCPRRAFLKTAGAISATLAAPLAAAEPAAGEQTLPQIRIGKHSFSRLVCGANPFNAGSHLSWFVNQAMREYYTPEQVLKTLHRCEEVGINTWQSGTGNIELYRRHVDAGGRLQFLAIESDRAAAIDKLVQGGCLGVAHHGEATDHLFKTGQLDKINDFLKRVRDTGMLAGISTHMPDVVDAVESKGWDLDYYMTCVYERHRNEADLEKLLGHVPVPVGEVYLKSDPPRMHKMIQQTKRPCFAFKILAAGRLSERREWVEAAFRDTYAAIKPGDGVIIGIYDRYTDQPAECAAMVRRFGV